MTRPVHLVLQTSRYLQRIQSRSCWKKHPFAETKCTTTTRRRLVSVDKAQNAPSATKSHTKSTATSTTASSSTSSSSSSSDNATETGDRDRQATTSGNETLSPSDSPSSLVGRASDSKMIMDSSSSTAAAAVLLPATATLPPSSSSFSGFLRRLQGLLEESSGLSELFHLKQVVQEASKQFDQATQSVAESRLRVGQAQKAHELAHKKHVSLLMRREEWNADDAQAFVSMTSEEVTTRQSLLEAQEALRRAEDDAVQCQHSYMDAMRQRYHEEQMWQDKWRLLGTYGTWSLIGINTIVFLGGQYRADQREMKRLKDMEQLLIRSTTTTTQQQQQPSSDIMSESLTTNTNTNTNIQQKDNKVTVVTTDRDDTVESVEQQDFMVVHVGDADAEEKEDDTIRRTSDLWKEKLTKYLQEVHIHAPSVALGAMLSASCFIVVSLVVTKR